MPGPRGVGTMSAAPEYLWLTAFENDPTDQTLCRFFDIFAPKVNLLQAANGVPYRPPSSFVFVRAEEALTRVFQKIFGSTGVDRINIFLLNPQSNLSQAIAGKKILTLVTHNPEQAHPPCYKQHIVIPINIY